MEPRLRTQTEWGWNIAAYLFLAGVGAGAYAAGALLDLAGRSPLGARIGVVLGFPLVLAGTLFLIADLGVKPRALRAFLNPGTSWISRGTVIISTFMILGAAHLAAWIWPFGWLEGAPLRHALAGINLVFAALTMIYTGVLLGASRPISFWSTAMLPAVFLVSALSTGAMAILLAAAAGSALGIPGMQAGTGGLGVLARADLVLLVAEGLAVALYLQATHKTAESRASASLLLKGRLAGLFWGGVVGLGLAVPAAAGLLEVAHVVSGSSLPGVLGALSGLAGGLLLRYSVLAAGVRAPLRAGGIGYSFPTPVATIEPLHGAPR